MIVDGSKMRAVVVAGQGRIEWRQIPVPVCGDDDVILEVKCAGICGADLHWESGEFVPGDTPFVLGHEFAGVICEVGKNMSDRWKVGDRVVSDNTGYACGVCSACARGDFVHCARRQTLGAGLNGGFAKYCRIPGGALRVHPNAIMRLPDSVSFEEAAALEPAANAYRAVIQEARVVPGDTVVVAGLGPLGLFSIQMARAAGASRVIALGRKRDWAVRFPLAEKLGAAELIATDEVNAAEKITELYGDDEVRVVIDAAGTPSVMNEAMEYMQHDGVFVRVGNPAANYNYSLLPLIDKQITVIGHMGYNTTAWRNTMTLLENHQLVIASLITRTLPLEEYRMGFELMRTKQAAKVILMP